MARKGYKTITVRQEVYDMLIQEWSKHKKEYIKKGITSLTGFIAYLIEREENKRELQVKA